MLEPTIVNKLLLILELGIERCTSGINILAIQIPLDGLQGNVNPLAADSKEMQRTMWQGMPPCLGVIGEFPHNRHRTLGPYPNCSSLYLEPFVQ